MSRVIFFQKPGCVTNGRQRAQLAAAGHEVEGRDLLSEPWTAERLRAFFGDTPVADWFNKASPRVKSGEIRPAEVAPEAALAAMLADPLLIRRPLVECGDLRCAGFDREPVLSLLGGGDLQDLQDCAHVETGARCVDPAR